MARIKIKETFTVEMTTTFDIRPDRVDEFIGKLKAVEIDQSRIDNIEDCLRRIADNIHIGGYNIDYLSSDR